VLSIEQRVKIVEDRMADHSQLFADMRQGLLQFEARVDRRFEQVETRLAGLDQKMDTGFAALDRKIDSGVRWTSGIMLTGLIAIVAAILSR
jgi:t-SNARE complex subunit (syntaxin)